MRSFSEVCSYVITRQYSARCVALVSCLAHTVVGLLAFSAFAQVASSEWLEDFELHSLDNWYLPRPSHWERVVIEGNGVLHLAVGGPIGTNPRRPVKFAILADPCLVDFALSVKLKKDPIKGESDLIVVFAYQDKEHFYYVHLSNDTGDVSVHNGIFKIDGADRERIAGKGSTPALPDSAWHQVAVIHDHPTSTVRVYIDGESKPRFQVSGHPIPFGRIGLGSFNNSGMFDELHLDGTAWDHCSAEINSPLDH